MPGNRFWLGNVADWFDDTTNRMIALRDRALEWVDPSGAITGRDHPYLRGIGGNPIAYLIEAQNLSLPMLQGFADVLRIGNGVRDGGWGYAQDALRLAIVAGTVVRGVTLVAPRLLMVAREGLAFVSEASGMARTAAPVVTEASGAARAATRIVPSGGAWRPVAPRAPALAPIAAAADSAAAANPIAIAAADSPLAIQPPNTVSCTVVSIFNAMQRVGWRLFVSVDELASGSGFDDLVVKMGRGLFPQELRQLFNYVRLAGARVTEFTFRGRGLMWGQFQELAAVNRRGVFVVTIDFVETSNNRSQAAAHTLQAIYDGRAADGVRFLDTDGNIFNGIAELRQVYTFADLAPDYPIGFVHDSTLVADTTSTVAGFGAYVRLIPIVAVGGVGAAVGAALSSSGASPAPN